MRATGLQNGAKGEFQLVAGDVDSSDLVLVLPNEGVRYSFSEKRIVSASPTFKWGTSESNKLSVGGCVAGSFSVGLYNGTDVTDKLQRGLNWTDAYFDVHYHAPMTNGSTTRLYLGRYWVDNKSESGHILSFSCYDYMNTFDKYTLDDHNIKIDDTTTTGTLIEAICKANNNYSYTGLKYPNIKIPSSASTDITERLAIYYVAQMCGQFAVIQGNTLLFDWYTDRSQFAGGTTFGHDLDFDNLYMEDVIVETNNGNSNQGMANSSGGYYIEVNSNPFITDDNLETITQNIKSALNGLSFRPGSFSIQCNPGIEAGDQLQISTGEESQIPVIVTNVTYKTSTLQETISSDANRDGYSKKKESDDGSSNNNSGGNTGDTGGQGGDGGDTGGQGGDGGDTGSGCNHPDAEIVKW